MSASQALLEVEGLTKHFPVTRGVFGRVAGQVRAVDGLSFDIARGETLGLVGESGSGKTTAGRSILRLIEPTAGRVLFDGIDVIAAGPRELRDLRRKMQIVFQDPYGSLNPRLRVVDIVGEALEVHGLARGAEVEKRVAALLERVGLSPSWINRYPHEFSGGQRQRLGVARAIALEPKLIVCDEPVSALDVSIQAQVVNLLKDLGRELGLSYLLIAHDLSVVRHVSHRVAVMYLGQLVELAPTQRLFAAPAHPYTRALLSAIPVPDPSKRKRRLVLAGDVPSPLNPPSGCRFHTRCPAVFERCRSEEPAEANVEPGHTVKCFHAYDVEGPDWYAIVSERIERASKDNALENAGAAPVVDPEEVAKRPEHVVPSVANAAKAAGERRTQRFVALALVVGLVLGVFVQRPRTRQNDAGRELAWLRAELASYAKLTGSYPKSLSELGWRLPPIFPDGRVADPWGRPWVYRAPAMQGGPGELRSLGPDGVPSGDDVR